MKKILVPTDFSDNAYRAAQYAAKMGIEQHYSLHILHCYTASTTYLSHKNEEDDFNDDPILQADQTMKEWLEKLQKEYPKLPISFSNERGLLEEVIPHETEQADYAAVVMGTTGTSKNKNIFWGSNTALIIGKSHVPVIAIPNIEGNHTIKKIGLLTTFKAEELVTLQEYMQLFKGQVDLDLIHIYNYDEEVTEVKERIESWIFNIRKFNHIEKIGYVIGPTVKDDQELDTVPEVISKLVDIAMIDMLLVSNSRRPFLKRLFAPSVSKALTLDLPKPAFFSKTV